MMLLYKAWRDSRIRFLAGVVAMILFFAFIALYQPKVLDTLPRLGGRAYNDYVDGLAASFG